MDSADSFILIERVGAESAKSTKAGDEDLERVLEQFDAAKSMEGAGV